MPVAEAVRDAQQHDGRLAVRHVPERAQHGGGHGWRQHGGHGWRQHGRHGWRWRQHGGDGRRQHDAERRPTAPLGRHGQHAQLDVDELVPPSGRYRHGADVDPVASAVRHVAGVLRLLQRALHGDQPTELCHEQSGDDRLQPGGVESDVGRYPGAPAAPHASVVRQRPRQRAGGRRLAHAPARNDAQTAAAQSDRQHRLTAQSLAGQQRALQRPASHPHDGTRRSRIVR